MQTRLAYLLILCVSSLPLVQSTIAQTTSQQRAEVEAAVLSVAEKALEEITNGDVIALTDLMVPEAQMYPTAVRNGTAGYSVRTREAQRATPFGAKIVERGYSAEVKVAGTAAMVWMPYDLYVDGEWSHCGIDIFTLIRVADEWKIASIAWTVEQPPVCKKHPDGPPKE